MKNKYEKIIHKVIRLLDKAETELEEVQKYPRYKEGTTKIFGADFTYHDSASFYVTYKEVFQGEIYKFTPSPGKNLIIDCGANMGISVVYFAKHYPNHSIKAFEPDPYLFTILKKNIESLGFKNVELFNKAIWDKPETLNFYTDGGMGGRLNESYKKKDPVAVETIVLKDILTDKVDFLKVDIEGAENVVLPSCAGVLRNANSIFFEYHNKINASQTLHQLLNLMVDEGFTYNIKESFVNDRPFVDRPVICEAFDMALNVFCYKK